MNSLTNVKKPQLVGMKLPENPWFHFSVDDVLPSLLEVSKSDIPLFDHSFMKFMKFVYENHGLVFDLKLFMRQVDYDGADSSLFNVRVIRDELLEAGNFIRFAPHGDCQQIAPHEQVVDVQTALFAGIYNQIDRFAGKDMYCSWVRLHYFSELYEQGPYFAEKGVTALLTTDRPAGSYRMGEEVASQLNTFGFSRFNSTNFIRTHFRLEDFANARLSEGEIREEFVRTIKQYGFIVMLAHEYELTRPEVRSMLIQVMNVLKSLGVCNYNQSLQEVS